MRAPRGWLLRGVAVGTLATLTGCGGGGGGVVSTPTPVAALPAPAPTPTPTPVAPSSFDTAEYRATVGAVNMNALAAYNAGATGAGIGIAIVDSGIDLQSAEFDSRVSAASQAFAGDTTVDDEGGHGTAVAFTAAGRRNGTGSQGVAFAATVIAERVDRPGSCASTSTDGTDPGCSFPTSAITQAVDAARGAGARVINLSLGGSAMPQSLQAAIGRATAAGIVVVIAAGNDGTDNPDPFTDVALTANARGQVIIAGSIGATNSLSSFSDKAGASAAAYLTAVGERVRAPDQNGVTYLWSGTSFAAPQISGAVALLAQAFPNMTGAQIVDLLLTTARDVGAAGTDPIYGRGILDLTRAFQPQGTSVVAGTAATRVSLTGNGSTSTAMGDAGGTAGPMGVGAVILDGFDRAFAIDLARTIARAAPTRPLATALRSATRVEGFAAGGTAVSMTLAPTRTALLLEPSRLAPADADAARAIAGSVTERLGSRTSFAMGFNAGAGSLAAGLAGQRQPAFLIADPTAAGFDGVAAGAVAVRQTLGRWGVTATTETGAVISPRDRLLAGAQAWQRTPYSRAGLALDRAVGALHAGGGVSRLAEQGTVLGARFADALGSPDATSWFFDADARLDSGGWTLGGSVRRGWTDAHLHGLAGGGRLRTGAWGVDVGRAGLFGDDSLGLRIAQPLRVAEGGLDLTLPTAWDYASGTVAQWTPQRLGLAPEGRELDAELRYARPFAGGLVQTNLYWRRNPGNVAALPADAGAALRWSRGF